jgi:hypothetical protein
VTQGRKASGFAEEVGGQLLVVVVEQRGLGREESELKLFAAGRQT